jgi:hypothetical protein
MKLKDLAQPQVTKQTARVFESYFGTAVNFNGLSRVQTKSMLHRVRGLIREHRQQQDFHRSEQNPAYLKLVMMEQGLAARLQEVETTMVQTATDDAKARALATAQQQQKKRQIQDQIKQHQDAIRDLQQEMNSPVMAMGESRRRRLREASEVQQAQVVLASKDMVDQVQKMLEQVTAIQFKDLPALVDQINNEVGQAQGTQFNNDATAALSGLVQNLQGAKQQLDAALKVITGEGAGDMGMGTDMTAGGADLGAGGEAGAAADLAAADDAIGAAGADLDAAAAEAGTDMEEPAPPQVGLGRGRR